MDNRLVIGGVVGQRPQTRKSPAGIPISRFPLRHQSTVQEASMDRQVRFSIAVVAAGETLQPVINGLQEGDEVVVTGFVSRSDYRHGDQRLSLHAQAIEKLNTVEQMN